MTAASRPGLRVAPLLLALSLLAHAPWAYGDETTCGTLARPAGSHALLDYRTATNDQLRLVEDYHFTPNVEMLKKGQSGTLGADLDFALRAIPNHHRALVSLMNLQFKEKTERPVGTKWTVSCYFERAMRFKADDGTVHTIYGVYLLRLGKAQDAVKEFEIALSLGDDGANLRYNLGLAYVELRDYDKAVEQARKAYDMGAGFPALRDKLRKAGKWPPP